MPVISVSFISLPAVKTSILLIIGNISNISKSVIYAVFGETVKHRSQWYY